MYHRDVTARESEVSADEVVSQIEQAMLSCAESGQVVEVFDFGPAVDVKVAAAEVGLQLIEG